MNPPKIIDCTLREGNQNPGVGLTIQDSMLIARRLSEFGVGCIEIGHPAASDYEFRRAKSVCDLNLKTPILCHARALSKDIDAVKSTGASWVGIFIAVNDLSLKAKYSGRTFYEILDLIQSAVLYAKSLGLKVRFTVEDASRTPYERLLSAFSSADESGANRLCITDTVGVLEVHELHDIVDNVKSMLPQAEIEIHLHDDRGLAMANALSVSDKVSWVSTSVNGLGERCGIVDTVTFYENLNFKYSLGTSKIVAGKKLSELVSVLTNTDVESRRPVVGVNAFKHSSRLHVKAFNKDVCSYLWSSEYAKLDIHSIDKIKPPVSNIDYINFRPEVRSSSELPYHRHGVGDRFVLLNRRTLPSANQYCIARKIPFVEVAPDVHVDAHRHNCSSVFVFLGDKENYRGLKVKVNLDNEEFIVNSPASVSIPPGVLHSYSILLGSGTFINFVLSGDYEQSIFEQRLD